MSLYKSFDKNYESAEVQDEHHATGSDYATVIGCKFDLPDDLCSSDHDAGGPETNSKEVSSEKVFVLKRSRSAFTGVLTRRLNLLHDSIHGGKNSIEIEINIDHAEEALDKLEICHNRMIKLYEVMGDFDMVIEEEHKFKKEKERALNQIDSGRRWLIANMVKDDKSDRNSIKSSRTVSSTNSSSSIKLAAANAAAKKAALEAKAKAQEEIFMKQMKMKQLEVEVAKGELEAEIAAATAEEEVYRRFEEEETSVIHEASQSKDISEEKFPPKKQQDQQEMETLLAQTLLNQNAGSWPQAYPLHPTSNQVEKEAQMQNNATTNQQLIEVLLLPKVELCSFDGDPLKYWQFVKTFQECVGITSVSARAKLTRLLQNCTGRAAKAVACCNLMNPEDGYKKALDILQQRFGNELYIKEAWLRKVTEGPYMKASDKQLLSNLADDLRNCVETLKALGHEPEVMSDKVIEIVKRLPFHLQNRWRTEAVKYTEKYKRYPGFTLLADFLERASLEVNDPFFQALDRGIKQNKDRRTTRGTSFNVKLDEEVLTKAVSEKNNTQTYYKKTASCSMCKGKHWLYDCNQFQKLTPEKRLMEIRKARLCFNCLSSNHRVRTCRKAVRCEIKGCSMWHHKLLHDAFSDEVSVKAWKMDSQPKVNTKSCVCNPSKEDSKVALPIVKVKVSGLGKGRYVSVLALLDPGSNSTFCTKTLINRLGISGKQVTMNMATLNKVEDSEVEEISLEMLTSGRQKQRIKLEKVYALKRFPPNLEDCVASPDDVKYWKHLENLDLPNIEAKGVDLVIGQDYPHLIKPLEIRSGKDNEPYAIRTVLGWTINGPVGDDSGNKEVFSNVIHTIPSETTSLSVQVEKFWAIDGYEDLGKETNCMSKDDKEVLRIWDQSLVRVGGHFQLPIPFRHNPPELCNNRSMVDKRQMSLRKRLERNPSLLAEYCKEIQMLIAKGYAEAVPQEDINAFPGLTWYLPIFNVKNENKPEKFRLVFDCAAEFMGKSLNKQVLQGPDLTNRLVGVIQRFRKQKVAMMSDIETMFYQVKVTPKHRNALRFLWWTDGDLTKDPDIYRMTVHPFGGVWSPSCATYALQHTAEDQKHNFDDKTKLAVLKNFYVDDLLISTETEEEAINLRRNVDKILKTGGFKLTKWASNSKSVLQDVPLEERTKNVRSLDLDIDSLPVEHALGLEWNTVDDVLAIRIKEKSRPFTKRGLLSVLSSVYDPLGLVSPFVLVAKKIFQDECRMQKGWDDQLSEEGIRKWSRWLSETEHLKHVNIDRCFKPPSFGEVTYQIHNFCDASEYAYGTVSYLRLIDGNNNIHCAFLVAKSRLAPMKFTTIPRLELSAAAIAVKIDKALQQELSLNVAESVFWTDSMIVLQYIKNKSKRFKTFVANRVAYIHQSTDSGQWRYVPSRDNPADDVSRGLQGEEMKRKQRWLQGPEFLWKPEEEWMLHPDVCKDILADDVEVKRVPKSIAVVGQVDEDVSDKFIKSFSSWFRMKKALAWILRFGHWLRQGKPTGYKDPLTTREMYIAENFILGYMQRKYFAEEIKILKENKGHIQKSSTLYKLEPFLDEMGLLRVGGRLHQAPVSQETKHPVIVPRQHEIVKLIVRESHEETGHSGREYTVARIRQVYWIPRARPLVKEMIRNCVICNRYRGLARTQKMGDLPEDRLTPGKPAFTFIGIDCFGPFLVKRGRSQEKRYGCIFTCLVTRGIHLEKLNSLDTDSFINGLARFMARRGIPEKIRSDNGTNFVGAYRELKEAASQLQSSSKLHNKLLMKNVKWEFNPPYASHMGGVWERPIRTVRNIMNILIKKQVVDDERLETIFCEAESIVNNRPLTPISDDPADFEPLTPNHLLLLRPGCNAPLTTTNKTDPYSKRWRHVQFIANQFWSRWVKEYLPTLQLRSKWLVRKANLKAGDLVMVMDLVTPRHSWPLARVTEVFKGKDDLVRSVKLQTATCELVRPITKLCVLEGIMEDIRP